MLARFKVAIMVGALALAGCADEDVARTQVAKDRLCESNLLAEVVDPVEKEAACLISDIALGLLTAPAAPGADTQACAIVADLKHSEEFAPRFAEVCAELLDDWVEVSLRTVTAVEQWLEETDPRYKAGVKVHLFRGTVDTDTPTKRNCGKLSDIRYCPANRTFYLKEAQQATYTPGQLEGVVYVNVHEICHDWQWQTGQGRFYGRSLADSQVVEVGAERCVGAFGAHAGVNNIELALLKAMQHRIGGHKGSLHGSAAQRIAKVRDGIKNGLL